MKKKMLSLMVVVCLLLCACDFKNLNSDTSTSDTTENQTTAASTETTTYEGNFGTELSADVSGNEDVSHNEASADSEEIISEPVVQKVYVEPVYNTANTELKVPTWIEYYDGLYFIVDCYHDQVIFSDSLDKDIYQWQIMDANGLNRPHTIAFDGEVYMVDDTDNNRIVAYTKNYNDDGTIYFKPIQEFTDMGDRPHYIKYIDAQDEFYAWSSMSGQMWVFKRSKDKSMVFLDRSYTIPDLKDVYVRSFTILDGMIYFVSGIGGDCCIYEVDFATFEVVKKIPVAPEIGGMVQITKIQDYYYISVSTSLYGETELKDFIRTDSLEHLQAGQYTSYYDYLTSGFDATPYNLTEISGSYYLTLHRSGFGSGVVKFDVINNEPCNMLDLFY